MNHTPDIFRLVIEKSQDAISQWNREFKLIFANQSFTESIGITEDLLLGKTILELSQPEIPTPCTKKLKAVFETAQPLTYEFDFATKAGDLIFQSQLLPELAADGTVQSVLVINRDITLQRKSEQALKKCEENSQRLSELVENIPDPYLILYPDDTICQVSDAYLQATLTKRKSIIGKNLFDVFPDNPAAPGANAVRNLRASLDRVRQTNKPHRMAIQQYDVPQSAELGGGFVVKYWLPLNTPVLDEQGQLQYIIHKVEDVTEKILTENKLAREFRHLKDAQTMGQIGSFEHLLTENIITCSKEWYRIHGLESQSEVVTLDRMYSFFHPEDWQESREAIHHTLTTGDHLHLIHRIVRADGTVRFVQRKAEILNNEQGTPYKVYGTIQDITEHVEAQKKVEEREALLRATEEVAQLGSYELNVATMSFRFSDGMYRLFGEEPHTFVPTLAFLDEHTHPDDVLLVKAILDKAIQDKSTYYYNRRICRADGEWRTLEARGRVECNNAGEAIKLIGLVQDVTDRNKAEQELKQSRKLLQTTIDSSLDMIQVFEAVRNENGEIIDFKWILNNHTSEKIYGDVLGKNLLEYNPGVVETGIFDTFKQVVETGIPDQSERHYVHEQFDGWFFQSTVKMYDGVATTTRDITEHKRAEQELEESRALFQSVLNNTASSIMLLKPVRNSENAIIDFQYTYTNEQTLKSVNRSSLTGKFFTEEFPEAQNSDLFQYYARVIETGEEFHDQVDLSSFGFPVWAQVFAQKLNDVLLVTYFDITERKNAEQELISTKEFLQVTLDTTLQVVQAFEAVRDEEGKIIDFVWIYTNQRWKEQHGVEMVGKRMLQENPGVIESGLFEKFIQVTETGVPLDHEQHYAFEQFDGWFFQTLAKLGDGFVMTTVDITERKRTEQEILFLKDEIAQRFTDKYYSIFNAIDEGFCIYELVYDDKGEPVDLRWVEVNPAYEKQTGLKDVVGMLHSELSLATEKYWLEIYDKVAKTGESTYFENWHEPTQRWYYVFASQIGGEGSRQVAVVFEDITERKQREQQQEYLFRINDTLRSRGTSIEIEETITALAMEHFGVDRCYYCTIEGDSSIIRRDARRVGLQSAAGNYPLSSFALFKKVIDGGAPVIVNDAHSTHLLDESLRDLCLQLQVVSFVDVPVIKNGKVAGILCLVQSTPRVWTEVDVQLAVETAERTWAAVERARTEEALRESEEKYRTLFDSMDEGYCIIQMLYDEVGKAIDFRYLQVNQAFERNNGLQNAEGKTIRELAPDIEPKWINIYNQVAQSGIPRRFEEDSEALQRVFSLYAFRIGDPAEHKVAVIFSDITEHKKGQQALRQSEEQFRLFVTASSDIIYKMNADLSRMHELTDKNFLPDTEESGDSWVDMYIPSEDRPLVAAAIQEAIRTKSIFELEHRIIKSDDTIAWISSRAIPVTDCLGNIIEWFGTASDISLRKQAEQQLHNLNVTLEQQVTERTHELHESKQLLQTVFDTTLIEMSILKAVRDEQSNILDFRIELVNKELEKETGRKDLVGKLYAEEYPSIKTTGLFDIMLQVMETGQPKGTEYYFPYDGFNKWFSCMFVRLKDGLIATNLDITERKNAELKHLNSKLQQQKELLIAILEAQEEERSRISESLHNGVAQILYATKLHVEDLVKEVPGEYVQKLNKLLLNAISEIRRVSHELVPLILKDFGLKRAIMDMCGSLKNKSLQLECEIENFETALDTYYELVLYRISQELINNILKHSKATEAKILLYQEEDLVYLKVRDNGIGMKAAVTEHKGIGLRSIRDRVKLLNGTFEISVPSSGKGTQVIISIPI
ncbi:PAS domain-containing protein [Pontibacter sp. KCTC 32443]|uniref:PAS domain-containing protein n=1 Tax=Pontibacter TaxID=323449 RepID=UPI00164D16AF|nr:MULTISPECIES: PAS domain-containing protein [Pontibacter]MBC5773099.1 PAS domain-containing protein [Pontibacter sp. KCTC 32443]